MSDPQFRPTPQMDPFGLADVGYSATPTFADLDADGDLDLLVGNLDGNLQYFRNVGSASAPAFVHDSGNLNLPDVGSFAAPTLGDVDADGDLDLIVGTLTPTGAEIRFFRNEGTSLVPSFTSQASAFGLIAPVDNLGPQVFPTLVDIDRDGDLDAVVGTGSGAVFVYMNTGTVQVPAFSSEATDLGLGANGAYARPSFADLDGDGDLDALIGYGDGNFHYFQNNGTATLPLFSAEPALNPFGFGDIGAHAAPVLVDIDHDGDLEAFVGTDLGHIAFFSSDHPGITVTLSNGATAVAEGSGGATDTFNIVLSSAPLGNVVIALDFTSGQVTADLASLTFTADNWNVAQTVTVAAVDDRRGEGAHQGIIQFHVGGTDSLYSGFAVAPVVVNIADNDLPQVDPTFAAPLVNPFGLYGVGANASIALVDIDSDGDLDAFLGGELGNNIFFRNGGTDLAPTFAAEQDDFGLYTAGSQAKASFVDLNADGDLDAFLVSPDGSTSFRMNVGTASAPAFVSQAGNFGLGNPGRNANLTFVDIDGDGDQDAFAGQASGDFTFYRNIGTTGEPDFQQETGVFGLANVGSNASPNFMDIDGDGDPDALVGTGTGDFILFRNAGSATAPNFINEASNPFNLLGVGGAASPTLADVDADGDPDLLTSDQSGNVQFFNNTALRPAGLTITVSDGSTLLSENGMTDGYSVVLNRAPTHAVVVSLVTNHQVTTSDVAELVFTPANWDIPQTVMLAAIDDTVGEGSQLVVVAHRASSADSHYDGLVINSVVAKVFDNDLAVTAQPSFANPEANPFGLANTGPSAKPAFADLDGDGDLDVVVGLNDGSFRFFRNEGSTTAPSFVAKGETFGLGNVGSIASPAFVDIDTDGDLDAFVGNLNSSTAFFLNVGTATAPAFVQESSSFGLDDGGNGADPAFVDIDGDGDLDAFVGQWGSDTLFFRNVGTATAPEFSGESDNFGLAGVGLGASPTFADLDGDGDLDALLGQAGGAMLFYRNLGSALLPNFVSESTQLGLTSVQSAASPEFVDIDGDGDLDALIGNGKGDLLFFRNTAGTNAVPVVSLAPDDARYVDTRFDDRFGVVTRQFTATDADGNTKTFGIAGGIDLGALVSKAGDYGLLTIDKASGLLRFTPNDAAIEALNANASAEFTVTVTDGTGTVSAPFRVNVTQDGATESNGDDTLAGTTGNDFFDSLAGNDTLDGGAGIDQISFASALSGVTVSLVITSPQDTGGSGVDTLFNFENILGSASKDFLTGNALANVLNGGADADKMAGGAGSDTYYVDHVGDRVSEAGTGGTADTVYSKLASYTLPPNVEIGRINTTAAANLTGNTGANTLVGGTGKNVLVGGLGADKLAGGLGADRFEFNTLAESGIATTTRDSILDFSHAQGDRIDLFDLDANSAVAGGQAFTKLVSSATAFSASKSFTAAGQLYYDQTADVLYGNTDSDPAAEFSIKVLGVTSLVPGDFVL